jgi:metallo-beta-lactamase class B
VKRLATLLFLALPLFAQKDPTSRSWNQPVEPFRIAGNLYYVGASDVTSYLITSPAGHMVLDGGFAETAPMILANIKRLGFRIQDVKLLLSSHSHEDHAGGLAALKSATGAKFVSSAGDAAQHARGGIGDPQFGDALPYPPIRADRIIQDQEQVTLGGVTLTPRITAGHTRGCTTWTMNVSDAGKKHSAVFVCSASVPGNYKLVGNREYPDVARDYRRTFATLNEVDVSGHLPGLARELLRAAGEDRGTWRGQAEPVHRPGRLQGVCGTRGEELRDGAGAPEVGSRQ